METAELTAMCEAIYATAIKGLVTHAIQQEQGYLYAKRIEGGLESEEPRRLKRPPSGAEDVVGEWTVEGVRRPILSLLSDGRWEASMSRSCNPHCFSVYISEAASTPEAALKQLHARVRARDWR